jgi:hypothetical protein
MILADEKFFDLEDSFFEGKARPRGQGTLEAS